jgi:hypothetical protein
MDNYQKEGCREMRGWIREVKGGGRRRGAESKEVE